MLSTAAIAKIAHEANRTYCESLGDFSQELWEDCLQWQRTSAMNGVLAIEKGVDRKLHPCMVPFNELPAEQQMKDHLFFAIVTVLLERT